MCWHGESGKKRKTTYPSWNSARVCHACQLLIPARLKKEGRRRTDRDRDSAHPGMVVTMHEPAGKKTVLPAFT